MTPRSRLPLVALGLGLALTVNVVTRARMIATASFVGGFLAQVLPAFQVPATADVPDFVGSDGALPVPETVAEASFAVSSSKSAPCSRGRRGSRKPSSGVYVDEKTVLRLANAGVVPSGHLVPATRTRPPGIALSGVSALGVGLRDGDVLTEVEGQSIRSKGQVVALVVMARQRRDKSVSAVFFREGEPWTLVVGMPYPETPPSSGGTTG